MRGQGRFVAEGWRVLEALLDGWPERIEALLLTERAAARFRHRMAALPESVPVGVVASPAVLEQITGVRFHQGCLGLATLPPQRRLEDLPSLLAPGPRLAIVLEGVTDPDNVGTIFRTGAAFGADAVLLAPGCAHPLYRKALRTSVGTALRLLFAHLDRWPAEIDDLAAAGFCRLALTPRPEARNLAGYTPPGDRLALFLGSEEGGLGDIVLEKADDRLRIALDPSVDSLNVA
ncbi:MAG: TrmH family RNA methyltransferase, partial [Planctomycetota bacterium]